MTKGMCIGIVAMMVSVTSCATAGRDVLEACDQYLQAAVLIEAGIVVVGDPFEATVTLTNTSAKSIEACFGPSWEVTFLVGREARGFAQAVDHPGCAQRFVLDPGQSASRSYSGEVPDLHDGVARLMGGIQVTDPRHCDKYGCNRTWVKWASHPEVALRRKGV